MNLINQYSEFILKLKPSKLWLTARFIIHWLTLPLKLMLIAGLGCYQILVKSIFTKNRPLPVAPGENIKKTFFTHIFISLPVFKTEVEELYCNRVSFNQIADGTNQIMSHQCSRQGTYAFLMDKLDLRTLAIDNALSKHIQGQLLCRGYRINPYEEETIYDADSTSGDMLCGLSLGMLGTKSDLLKMKFRQLIEGIVKNDYSLLERDMSKKSSRGMWQPGIETVGAQALTLLAALRIGDKISDSKLAKVEYKKMLWRYGYGLLSLFPTAYIDSQRGYFNDHNCLMALYVLSNLSDSKIGKLFWKIPMVYVWLLSRHWYNGYFTGLVKDCYPEIISKQYIEKCQAYLYEELPRTWGVDAGYVYVDKVPVKFNELPEDEFAPDIKQNVRLTPYDVNLRVRAGLGFIAHAIMLEANPKKLL